MPGLCKITGHLPTTYHNSQKLNKSAKLTIEVITVSLPNHQNKIHENLISLSLSYCIAVPSFIFSSLVCSQIVKALGKNVSSVKLENSSATKLHLGMCLTRADILWNLRQQMLMQDNGGFQLSQLEPCGFSQGAKGRCNALNVALATMTSPMFQVSKPWTEGQ